MVHGVRAMQKEDARIVCVQPFWVWSGETFLGGRTSCTRQVRVTSTEEGRGGGCPCVGNADSTAHFKDPKRFIWVTLLHGDGY